MQFNDFALKFRNRNNPPNIKLHSTLFRPFPDLKWVQSLSKDTWLPLSNDWYLVVVRSYVGT